jgi:hypothetical protein
MESSNLNKLPEINDLRDIQNDTFLEEKCMNVMYNADDDKKDDKELRNCETRQSFRRRDERYNNTNDSWRGGGCNDSWRGGGCNDSWGGGRGKDWGGGRGKDSWRGGGCNDSWGGGRGNDWGGGRGKDSWGGGGGKDSWGGGGGKDSWGGGGGNDWGGGGRRYKSPPHEFYERYEKLFYKIKDAYNESLKTKITSDKKIRFCVVKNTEEVRHIIEFDTIPNVSDIKTIIRKNYGIKLNSLGHCPIKSITTKFKGVIYILSDACISHIVESCVGPYFLYFTCDEK